MTKEYAESLADFLEDQERKRVGFERELASLINRYSYDAVLDVPDFVLAEVTYHFLFTVGRAVEGQNAFFGFVPFEAQLGVEE